MSIQKAASLRTFKRIDSQFLRSFLEIYLGKQELRDLGFADIQAIRQAFVEDMGTFVLQKLTKKNGIYIGG